MLIAVILCGTSLVWHIMQYSEFYNFIVCSKDTHFLCPSSMRQLVKSGQRGSFKENRFKSSNCTVINTYFPGIFWEIVFEGADFLLSGPFAAWGMFQNKRLRTTLQFFPVRKNDRGRTIWAFCHATLMFAWNTTVHSLIVPSKVF